VYHDRVSHRRPRQISRALACVLVACLLHEPPAPAEPLADAPRESRVHANRLVDSDSPYLLAHAHNPVDWYPWGAEAFERAKRENRPIFLSIGYSTCYWCHVAERTLFSNPQIAQRMNEWFVNIKVDREQRPDIDAAYMLATQLITGGAGGWPNNLFLTPDLEPFYAGGYFAPADDEFGRPGFPSVLAAIHEEWSEHPDRARQRAHGVAEVLARYRASAGSSAPRQGSVQQWSEQTRRALLSGFDAEHGGFSGTRQTTRFPQSPALAFLLEDYAHTHDAQTLRALTVTLDAMAYGGIYDQLGGGFHRYSTERTWSVPHYEKMLYDNAQLLNVYARAWKLTGQPQYKRIAIQTRDYLRRCLTAPEGGFYTAQDAETDDEEGATYRWTRAQIEAALGVDAPRFLEVYSLTLNSEDAQSLDPASAPGTLRVASGMDRAAVEERIELLRPQRSRLFALREARPQPARDDKLLVGLNGLAIDALATSALVFGDREDLRDAQQAARRLWELAWEPRTKRVRRQIFQGKAGGDGYVEDYALLGQGFLSLYRATGDKVWLARAGALARAMLSRFDARRDGALSAPDTDDRPFLATVDFGNDAYPTGIDAAIAFLSAQYQATRDQRYAEAALRIARRAPGPPEQRPLMVAALEAMSLPLGRSQDVLPAARERNGAHVQARARARIAGDGARIVVTLHIEQGFHVNANPASFDFLIPTRVEFEGVRPTELRYPPGKPLRSRFAPDILSVYEGTVRIVATLDPAAVAGKAALRATVQSQACTQTVCLPPAEIPLTISLPRAP